MRYFGVMSANDSVHDSTHDSTLAHPSGEGRSSGRAALDAAIVGHGWTALVLPVGRDDARLAQLADRVVRVDGAGQAAAVIMPGRRGILLVDRRVSWSSDTGELVTKTVDAVGPELAAIVAGGPVGVVGLDHAGSVERDLEAAGVDLVAVGPELDALRAVVTERELVDVEHAAHLADRCFEWLLAELLPGRTEAQIAAKIHETALSMGASSVDVAMHHVVPGSRLRLSSDQPGTAVAGLGTLLLCTITVAGPLGHHAVLCRPIAFGELDEPTERAARGAGSAVAAVARRAVPGATIAELERAASDAAADEGAVLHATTICGIGRAAFEQPSAATDAVRTGHVLRVSCSCTADGAAALQAETIVIDDRVARRLAATAIGVFAPEFHRTPRRDRPDHVASAAD